MKLTNQQLNALLNQLEDRWEKEHPPKKVVWPARSRRLFADFLDGMALLPKKVREQFIYGTTPEKWALRNPYFFGALREDNTQTVREYRKEMENKILIASIDTSDLTELCRKLKITLQSL